MLKKLLASPFGYIAFICNQYSLKIFDHLVIKYFDITDITSSELEAYNSYSAYIDDRLQLVTIEITLTGMPLQGAYMNSNVLAGDCSTSLLHLGG